MDGSGARIRLSWSAVDSPRLALAGGRLPARRQTDERMTSPAKDQLMAALADVGVEPADYALIEQARSLVDEVNSRLRTRGSRMIYLITFCNAMPQRPSDRLAALEVPPGD
jgi:hypothetical protein